MHWHMITGEFPPACGGVGDYSSAVAAGLAAAGETVHVWCPATDEAPSPVPGVQVHSIAGRWAAADLQRMDAALNSTPRPRRLLVQWVPHAYGRRSLNLPFCQWLRRRGRSGDRLEVMVHEPCLAFGEGSLRQDVAATIHRAMLTVLLSRAQRVWVAIPAWADLLRCWTFGRNIPFCWLPVPSTVAVVTAGDLVARIRTETLKRPDAVIVGHFGTYAREVRQDLRAVLPTMLARTPEIQVHLLGRGSREMLHELRTMSDVDSSRVLAFGHLSGSEVSCHLQVCDLMVQPYRDGVSTRRTTLMAALAHGVPVVTTTGHLSEGFWRDTDVVATVAAEDLSAMAGLVGSLARNPERRQTLGAAARRVYDERFSLPRVISALRAASCEAM